MMGMMNPQMMQMMQQKGGQQMMGMMGKGGMPQPMGNPQMMQMMQQKGGPQMMQQKGGPGPMPQQQPQQPPQQQGPTGLNTSALANAPPQVQKQMIGEKLYPAIAKLQPELAGKVTGMMLEMDNSELIMLLESEQQLKVKVDDALLVLGA